MKMKLQEAMGLTPAMLATGVIAAGCGNTQSNQQSNPEIKTVTPSLVKQVAEHYVELAQMIHTNSPNDPGYAFESNIANKRGCEGISDAYTDTAQSDLSVLTVESKNHSGGYTVSYIQTAKKTEADVKQSADTVQSVLISKTQYVGCNTVKAKVEFISISETVSSQDKPTGTWLISENVNGKGSNFTTGVADNNYNQGNYSRINPQELFAINNVALSMLHQASTRANVSVTRFPNVGDGPVYKNNLGLNRTF